MCVFSAIQKNPQATARGFYHALASNLSFRNCATWANISTSAALCAQVSVNCVNVTFRNCAHWALINTCTACDTIFRNYVSHNRSNLLLKKVSNVSNASAKVQQKNQNTKYSGLFFVKKDIYFFFLAPCNAASSWAFGPVNPLSTSPFCLAKVVQFLAPFSRRGIPSCR